MKRFAPRLAEYETSEFDAKRIIAEMKRRKKGSGRKVPTSVALERETIEDLKALAGLRGVPYQILMRMFIVDGLRSSLQTFRGGGR